jgi:sugar transferase (PEP-CTERM/EpsH1 system associated)
MNILYIAHRIPYPPNKGDKIRAFHQIRQLSKNHSVHLACIVDDRGDLPHVDALREYCASVDFVYRSRRLANAFAAMAIFGRKPLSVMGFYSRTLAAKIRRRFQSTRIDRIFAYCSPMAEYVKDVSDIPKVIDFVDVDSDKWRLYGRHRRFPLSWVFRLESNRLGRYEERVARVFDRSILVTEREARLLRDRTSDSHIAVISNGVDLTYLQPPRNDVPRSAGVLVFTGVMDYFPNVDAVQYFCVEILPLVLREAPETRFHIVGRNPTPGVRRLESHNVVVTGEVPDVRPYLAEASVAVVPLRISRGVQNKILEAMAMGLPVVTTSQAIGGTEATTADGLRIADSPDAFAKETLALLRDPSLRQECSASARNYVERHHSWDNHGLQLERLLQDAVQQRAER